jgi:PQQ system protein
VNSRPALALVPGLLLALAVSGCEYGQMLRPKTLKQLKPEIAQLVDELPQLDEPNKEIIARLFPQGGLEHAERGSDGVFRAKIVVPDGQFIWNPSIITMQEGGDLELEFENQDSFSHHAAYLPSNGGPVTVTFAPGERARARVHLDSPGLYWFGCPVSNHAGRGMLGLVLVGGEVPAEAKLDRPPQPRPQPKTM